MFKAADDFGIFLYIFLIQISCIKQYFRGFHFSNGIEDLIEKNLIVNSNQEFPHYTGVSFPCLDPSYFSQKYRLISLYFIGTSHL
jgi:hypothetical protein